MGKKKVKFLYEDVNHFVEVESKSGCKLLSEEYINAKSKMKFLCKCGSEFIASFHQFKHQNKRQCNKCSRPPLWSYKKVKAYFDKFGYLLLENEYIDLYHKMKVECPNGHIYKVTFANFKREDYKCPYCNGKMTYNMVKKYFKAEGYKLLSKNYDGSTFYLDVVCDKGHQYKTTWHNFSRGKRCLECYLDNKYKEGNSNWGGGITKLNTYLRDTLDEWKFDSLEKYSFRCSITGTRNNLEVHHITSFNIIVSEVLDFVKLHIKDEISQYSIEELKSIKNSFLLRHKKELGLPLCKEIHDLFHKQYGYGDNTPKQFEEFKTRLKSGEFNNFLDENNLELKI